MIAAWGASWLKSWGTSWGFSETPVDPPVEGNVGGGAGWQIFGRRPWETDKREELKKELQAAVRRMIHSDEAPEVKKVLQPFKRPKGVDWTSLMADLSAIKTLILMAQEFDEDEEELLTLLMAY